jgi:hypothetical protein
MKPLPTKRLRIWEKAWRIQIVPRIKDKELLDGVCHYDTRTILLRKKAMQENAVGTLIHEVLHAVFPTNDEHSTLHAEAVLCEALFWLSEHLEGKLTVASPTEKVCKKKD